MQPIDQSTGEHNKDLALINNAEVHDALTKSPNIEVTTLGN